MAEIPSDVASSIAQTGFQAREAARDHNARGASQASAADRHTKAIDAADTTVDTADSDTAVFADAEGTGSEGRNPEEEQALSDEEPAQATDNGLTLDDEGNLHLDLEA